ncbi:hypothetical protein [Branchiibius sp. NY16-3462-2]|uniref:hypothetical protein n=1 Tax=Branchiibius sp. NY16-3462-2 TaxID=1807500 RepID=UPI0007944D84|nr:hypothetical protein [Branchiibius sp. NY16-3462-2]KYH43869.1 hypothetical protein AZH51_15665 [Branchiibius sp. NY16-3462-2]
MTNSYVQTQRAASSTAVAAGRLPLRRTAFGGCAPTLYGAGAIQCDAIVQITPRGVEVLVGGKALPQAALSSLLDYRLVFPTPTERAALVGLLQRNNLLNLAHAIEVTGSFPATGRQVVLTKALERAYWLPDTMDSTLATWTTIMRVRESDPSRVAASLASIVTPKWQHRTDGTLTAKVGSLLTSIDKFALRADDLAYARTNRAAAQQYRKSCSIATLWNGALAMDELARQEAIESGEVVRTEVTERSTKVVTVPLGDPNDPCKLRPDTSVLLFAQPGDPVVRATLGAITYVNGRLCGELSFSSKAGLAAAMPQGLFLTAEPRTFDGVINSGTRWSGRAVTDGAAVESLNVPLELAVAGAPR